MITKNVSESKPNRTGKNTYRQVCCYIATCWWSDRHSCRRVIHVLERELEIECRLWKGINIVLISINDKNSMLATTKSTLVNIHEAAWILLLFESQVARERGHWTFAVNLVVWDIKHTLRRAWTLQKWGVPFPSCLAILRIDQVNQGNQSLRVVNHMSISIRKEVGRPSLFRATASSEISSSPSSPAPDRSHAIHELSHGHHRCVETVSSIRIVLVCLVELLHQAVPKERSKKKRVKKVLMEKCGGV